jgi:hypothetical protein
VLKIALVGWISQQEFCRVMVRGVGEEAPIRWTRAGDVLAEAVAESKPADDLALLALAVALGTDRFGLSQMHGDRRRQVLAAGADVVRVWRDDERCPSSLSATLLVYCPR